jgi:glyoxylase-like metal-dependent hydrolase (beta-lactamase superfamily II)
MTGPDFRIGAFACRVVSDGIVSFNARSFFANAPEPLLTQYGITDSTIPTPFHCLVISTGTHTILIETGMGPDVPGAGQLLPNLRAADFDPGAVDTVILTHAHADHIGGALDAAGNPAFPNARYVLSESEWVFWWSDAVRETVKVETVRTILQRLRPQIVLIPADAHILPGLTAIPAPGHTPGQIALRIESGGAELLHVADVVAHPIHLLRPDWFIRADADPAQAIRTRRALLAQAAAASIPIFVYHFVRATPHHLVQEGDHWQIREER